MFFPLVANKSDQQKKNESHTSSLHQKRRPKFENTQVSIGYQKRVNILKGSTLKKAVLETGEEPMKVNSKKTLLMPNQEKQSLLTR